MASLTSYKMSNSGAMKRRRRGFQPVAQHLAKHSHKIGSKRGFHDNTIINHWRDIVGEELSRITRPKAIKPRRKDGSILVLDCVSAYASELSIRGEEIRIKINSIMGFEAIGKIQLHHQDVGFSEASTQFTPPNPAPRPTPENLTNQIAQTQNPELRAALEAMSTQFYNKGK